MDVQVLYNSAYVFFFNNDFSNKFAMQSQHKYTLYVKANYLISFNRRSTLFFSFVLFSFICRFLSLGNFIILLLLFFVLKQFDIDKIFYEISNILNSIWLLLVIIITIRIPRYFSIEKYMSR